MQRTQPNSLDDALIRLGGRITSWVLGVGLLSLHATVFTLAMVTLLFWNIYDSPKNLWVGDVFRRWGALLAFHAIAVAAGWAVWKLLRAEQRAIDAAGNQWKPVLTESPAFPIEPSPAATATWAAAPNRFEPARSGPDATQRATIFARQVVVTWVEWSNALGRHAIRAYGSTATMIRTRAQREQPGNTESVVPPVTWPAPTARSDEEEFIAQFSPGAPLPEGDGEVTPAPVAPPDIVLTTTVMAETPDPRPPVIPIVKDANATWVETATATWLPRPIENGASNGQNGHHPKPEISPAADAPDTPATG